MGRINDSCFTLTNHPCKYLNKKVGRCKIYNKRKEKNPNCLALEEMYAVGSFPKECQYIKNDLKYQKRTDTKKDPNEITNSEEFEAFTSINNKEHNLIAVYDTLRDFKCKKCNSRHINEEFGDRFSILFFEYTCEDCGHKWNTLKKQVHYTLKLLKIAIK